MPALGVYFVKPASNASIAAALICSGVSKSGSPAPKPQTSMPSAFMALAFESMLRVSEGVRIVARLASSMGMLVLVLILDLAKSGRLLAKPAFDQRLQIVFLDLDDAHFALGIFGRIGGVRGIDHDGRAELAADRARRRLGRIGRAEHFADFAHGVDPLIAE